MTVLGTFLPDLAADLAERLKAEDRTDLVTEIQTAKVIKVTYDEEAKAGYIYVSSSRSLNIVEQKIVGAHHGETISVEGEYLVNLDTDNFGRITGIEVLSPPSREVEALKRWGG